MLVALDTCYSDEGVATTAAVTFEWNSSTPIDVHLHSQISTEPYIPGEFFRKELPCIHKTLALVPPVEVIIVDSHVFLDDNKQPGMGAHLYNLLDGKTPVIGCAKNPFGSLTGGPAGACRQVYRGSSKKPLLVSAIGIDVDFAASKIKNMHGEYRIPTILKAVDRYSRDSVACTLPHTSPPL